MVSCSVDLLTYKLDLVFLMQGSATPGIVFVDFLLCLLNFCLGGFIYTSNFDVKCDYSDGRGTQDQCDQIVFSIFGHFYQ